MSADSRPQVPAGFTLLEIVVTIAIMAFIFGAILVNFNSGSARSNVTRGVEGLSSDLRAAAQKALLAEDFQRRSPTGWGIYFDCPNNRYTVFADFNGDRLYQPVEKYKLVEMPSNSKLVKAQYSTMEYSGTFSIFFKKVTTVPYFENNKVKNITGGSIVITVSNDFGQAERHITINPLGVIDLD